MKILFTFNYIFNNSKIKTMKKVTMQQFNLQKVKLIKDGGLEVSYSTVETSGSVGGDALTYENSLTEKSSKYPHPDLLKLLLQLKPIVARVFNFTFFRELVKHEDFNANEEQSRAAERFYQEIIGKIDITGVSISGEDAKAGAVITATFLTEINKNKTAINVPRIKFNSTTFGFEEELEELCDSIKDEVYEFLFEGKTAEPELFDEIPQNEEESGADLFTETEEVDETQETVDKFKEINESDEEEDLPEMDMEESDQDLTEDEREDLAND